MLCDTPTAVTGRSIAGGGTSITAITGATSEVGGTVKVEEGVAVGTAEGKCCGTGLLGSSRVGWDGVCIHRCIGSESGGGWGDTCCLLRKLDGGAREEKNAPVRLSFRASGGSDGFARSIEGIQRRWRETIRTPENVLLNVRFTKLSHVFKMFVAYVLHAE